MRTLYIENQAVLKATRIKMLNKLVMSHFIFVVPIKLCNFECLTRSNAELEFASTWIFIE